jgi:hypothetical protein
VEQGAPVTDQEAIDALADAIGEVLAAGLPDVLVTGWVLMAAGVMPEESRPVTWYTHVYPDGVALHSSLGLARMLVLQLEGLAARDD